MNMQQHDTFDEKPPSSDPLLVVSSFVLLYTILDRFSSPYVLLSQPLDSFFLSFFSFFFFSQLFSLLMFFPCLVTLHNDAVPIYK
jgi:hypothetical protein